MKDSASGHDVWWMLCRGCYAGDATRWLFTGSSMQVMFSRWLCVRHAVQVTV